MTSIKFVIKETKDQFEIFLVKTRSKKSTIKEELIMDAVEANGVTTARILKEKICRSNDGI